jgi:putative effector of murein hydrolase
MARGKNRARSINMNSGGMSLFFLFATIVVYLGTRWLYRRVRLPYLTPIITTPLILFLLMQVTGTSFDVYFADSHWLVWLLGPATIAFAYPIYLQRHLLRLYPLTLTAGVVVGLSLGIACSWLLARCFALPPELAHSMLSRTVSTPFAIQATHYFGGSQDLTVLCVIVTGIFGMLIGQSVFAWLGLRSRFAHGASFGAAAHGMGTVKAYELGEEEGAVASLTMVFSGILMVMLAPVLGGWLA